MLIKDFFNAKSALISERHKTAFEWTSFSVVDTFWLTLTLIKDSNEHGLKNEQVKRFIHRKNLHFDLIVMEETLHDAYLMFAHKFNSPIVTICEHVI